MSLDKFEEDVPGIVGASFEISGEKRIPKISKNLKRL